MSTCPSRLELSRWEAHPQPERPAELASHVSTCARCSAVFADIADAESSLLGADPAEASARAVRAIMETVQQQRRGRRWLQLLAPVFLVPAAAALLFVARPLLRTHVDGHQGQTSVKGELLVETYCKRGDKVWPAVDGADFLEGDRLRFAYSVGKPGYLLIFGVDDQGKVFPYYEENALSGVPVEAGGRVFLQGSVELDNHKGWERIFALWADRQFDDDAVRSSVRTALSSAVGDIRQITALDLPAQQVSMLLRRP